MTAGYWARRHFDKLEYKNLAFIVDINGRNGRPIHTTHFFGNFHAYINSTTLMTSWGGYEHCNKRWLAAREEFHSYHLVKSESRPPPVTAVRERTWPRGGWGNRAAEQRCQIIPLSYILRLITLNYSPKKILIKSSLNSILHSVSVLKGRRDNSW